MARVVLLDGPNLAVRSYHAAKGRMGTNGAAFLFINSLSRLLKDERPDRFLVCWDAGSAYRRALYPAYKANRGNESGLSGIDRDYIGDILTFLDLCELPLYYEDGFEADDVIAAAHTRHRAQGDHVVILSSDKDLLQLLDEQTEQVRFAAGNAETDRWGWSRFVECYGYEPRHVPIMMALTGDPGDNVPGVRGIGPKKALKLLQAADWDLDRALATNPEYKLAAGLSLSLVDLSTTGLVLPFDVPVFAPTDGSSGRWGELLDFCAQREMTTVVKRLEAGLLWP